MSKPLESFGKNLKTALGERSQAWLAKEAETTAAMISDYIKGKAFPNLKTLDRISRALGKPMIELLGNETPRYSPPRAPTPEELTMAVIERLGLEEDQLEVIRYALTASPGKLSTLVKIIRDRMRGGVGSKSDESVG